ncbi:MAG: hypothetical protein KME20_16390 [Kaiparowitsia implicata GSE-PSE-MK54-09C]|nr:hypothetical protein [Kaiparowitsia implicata GSE-PSE-MK54-09C]
MLSQSTEDRTTPRVVAISLLLWFLGVAAAGHAGVLIGSPAPLVGGYVVGTTLLLCALGLTIPPLRVWLLSLELRFLVLLHFVRFIGIAFLVSSATEGGLPAIFAERAGYGDIFAAITALALAVGFLPATSQFRRGLLLSWNVVGVVDLLQAVGTGVAIQLSGSSAMASIVTAPLMYIPFYFVPLLMFIHLVIFYRLAINALEPEGAQLNLSDKV